VLTQCSFCKIVLQNSDETTQNNAFSCIDVHPPLAYHYAKETALKPWFPRISTEHLFHFYTQRVGGSKPSAPIYLSPYLKESYILTPDVQTCSSRAWFVAISQYSAFWRTTMSRRRIEPTYCFHKSTRFAIVTFYDHDAQCKRIVLPGSSIPGTAWRNTSERWPS
jgi:hypothetical protein